LYAQAPDEIGLTAGGIGITPARGTVRRPYNGRDHVFTISRVEVSIVLDPEDGRLGVLGLGEEWTTAFTRFGIDNLAELVLIYKVNPSLLPRYFRALV
jgi:hypothetical protein